MNAIGFVLALAAAQTSSPPPAKVDVVAVVGCLRESAPDTWTLSNATDPVVSNANAPSDKEVASFAKSGTHEYRLTGVSVFNLPTHRGHQVLIKGLLNKATPIDRLNITSVTMISADCPVK